MLTIKKLNYTGLLLALIGWANALVTLWHRQKLMGKGLVEDSFCNLGGAVNCDAAALSPYSSIGPIPTSALGLAFYGVLLVLFCWMLLSNADKKQEEAQKAITGAFYLSLVGLVPTLVLAAISFGVMKNLCLMCLLSYIINIALVVVSFKAWKILGSAKKVPLKAPGWVWSAQALFIALGLFMPSIVSSSLNVKQLDAKQLSLYLDAHLRSPENNFDTSKAPFFGNKNAKIEIVEFSDYQCPYCAVASKTLPALLGPYQDKVKLVFKNYPLDPTCNPYMKNGGHALACFAAKSAKCVFKLKGNESFFKFKKSLFANYRKLSTQYIDDTAKALGLDPAQLGECRSSVETQQELLAEIEEAKAAGLQGTPSIYIDGKVFRGLQLPQIFQKAMEHYMAKQ